MTALLVLLATLAHADWKVDACRKACIPAHDAKVIACKTVETKDAGCETRADRERRDCEASCAKPKPPAKAPKKKPAAKPAKPAKRAAPDGPGKI